jgi:hypothetical protein
VSRVASSATAYTPKTTVVVSDEKPHAAWYVAYSGVGADEAARNDTVIDANPTSRSSGRPVGGSAAEIATDMGKVQDVEDSGDAGMALVGMRHLPLCARRWLRVVIPR